MSLERMLAVTRWFMSTLWGSYASRCTNGQHEKKPYNPILGEQFLCKLGDVECVCEQGNWGEERLCNIMGGLDDPLCD